MNVLKRAINGAIYVGIVVGAATGLSAVIWMFATNGESPLFQVGLALATVGLFVQGYLAGGDGNSEAKSAD